MSNVIAVTGGTGFIGGAVLSVLQTRGIRARLLARRPADLAPSPDAWEIVEGDLRNESALRQLVKGADAVLHIAGVVAAASADDFHEQNAAASERLAKIAFEAGVKRFVYVSSLAAREPQLSDYAASKSAAERLIEHIDTAMTRIIVRPPAVYGPGDRATLPLIDQLSRRHAIIPSAPGGRFSLMHADDLAEALVNLVWGGNPAGVYELDDGKSGGYDWPAIGNVAGNVTGHKLRIHFLPKTLVSLAALGAQAKSALTGKPNILTPGKVRELFHIDWVADTTNLNEHCDWRPCIGFRQGFATTLAWYREHGWLPAGAGGTSTQPNTYPGDNPT